MREPLIPITPELEHALTAGVVVTGTGKQAEEIRYAWMHKNVLQGNFAIKAPKVHNFDGWLDSVFAELERLGVERSNWSMLHGTALNLAFQCCAPKNEYIKHVSAVSQAWRLYVEWNLQQVKRDLKITINGRVFVRWVEAFQQYCEELEVITQPELPGLITQSVTDGVWETDRVTLFAVRELSPRRRELLNQLKRVGCEVTSMEPELRERGEVNVLGFASSSRECSAVAGWALEQFKKLPANSRIGIVVPSVNSDALFIRRNFEAAFFDCHSVDTVVNIGSGYPLRETRLCQDILKFLEWTAGPLSADEVLQLGRSPYLTGLKIPPTLSNRYYDRFDFKYYLRKQEPELRSQIKFFASHEYKNSIHTYVTQLVQTLNSLGWAADKDTEINRRVRTEILKVFGEVIKLSPLVGAVDWRSFVHHVRFALRSHTLSHEARYAPIQVLSREQSIGLQFDALWIAGNGENQWPPPLRPNPMIPISVQREAQIPRTTYPKVLEWAQWLTQLWSQSSPTVLFSYFDEEQGDSQEEIAVSPLLADEPEVALERVLTKSEIVAHDHPWAQVELQEDAKREYFADKGTAVLLTTKKFSTSILRNQSLCPFKAWSIHRLGLEDPPSPHRFPDAMDRGNLVHKIIEELLQNNKNKTQIAEITEEFIKKTIASILADMTRDLPQLLIDNECIRLKNIIKDWIDFESSRDEFEVMEIEQKHSIEIEGVEFTYRIDRMDKLTDDRVLVIDIKTGNASRASWHFPRLRDTQMPLYAIASSQCDGIAYLPIRQGKSIKFSGYGAPEITTKDIGTTDNIFGKPFGETKLAWRQYIEEMINNYLAGNAQVDPVKADVCDHCHLMNLCRQFQDSAFNLPTEASTNDE